MFKSLRKTAILLALCLCVSLVTAYAAPIDNNEDINDSNEMILAQYEITVDEAGEVRIEDSYSSSDASPASTDSVTRDFAVGLILYEKVGTNLYQFTLELNGGSYYTIGTASVTLDYGDSTIGVFTHGSTREDIALLTTNTTKYYTPGTYTVQVTGGYVNTYDHFGTLDQVTDDRIPLYFPTKKVTAT